ncbi:16384_t:CDS:2 [Cetraspora pellucida]|uniref:16384_t:CDS:1 n=1 Tax=Cetraspora pellucida TaxID=1433469 RepID=A0A9N9H003_9GLOM|nr:16384_t:CDS:2 [Cetraspora pellucida]
MAGHKYESRNDKKLNILSAIKFIVQAWKEVSSETICNCSWHTKILSVVQNNEPTNDNNENELIEEMQVPTKDDNSEEDKDDRSK